MSGTPKDAARCRGFATRTEAEVAIESMLQAIMALAIRLCGDTHAAADLTQDTALRAITHWRQ
ncbi:MAG: sigma factor, partial [Planctomycetota bacterium]